MKCVLRTNMPLLHIILAMVNCGKLLQFTMFTLRRIKTKHATIYKTFHLHRQKRRWLSGCTIRSIITRFEVRAPMGAFFNLFYHFFCILFNYYSKYCDERLFLWLLIYFNQSIHSFTLLISVCLKEITNCNCLYHAF